MALANKENAEMDWFDKVVEACLATMLMCGTIVTVLFTLGLIGMVFKGG